MMAKVYHALGFLLHQPPDVFSWLAENHMGKLLQIINSYQVPLKYLRRYLDSLKVHVGFSGTLLEQLLDKEVIDACRKIIDIPLLLNEYRESKNIEFMGLGYAHPVFPLIPHLDWDAQIVQGTELIREVFGQEPRGFWPAECGFCPEIIPLLRKNGYEYVILDSAFLNVLEQKSAKSRYSEDPYSSIGNITYHGIEISVVTKTESSEAVQKRALGNRQSLVSDWFSIDELNYRQGKDAGSEYEFWEDWLSPYLQQMYATGSGVKSMLLRELMQDWKVRHPVTVEMGNWVADFHHDYYPAGRLSRATTSRSRATDVVRQFSRQYHELKSTLLRTGDRSLHQEYLVTLLARAQKWLLRSQTGCYFTDEERWVANLYDNIKPGLILLNEVRRQAV